MEFVSEFGYWQWEMDLLERIQVLHADWLTPILKFICDITMHGELWIALAISLTIYSKTRKIGFTMLAAMIMGTITADFILKPLVQRQRPFQKYVDLQLITYEVNDKGRKIVQFVDKAKIGFDFYITKLPNDYSFPSGHSVCGFAASVSLFSRNKKMGIPALILATVIAFSRMYLFVHFPTDVFVGICIGTTFGIVSYFMINAIYKKLGKDTPCLETENVANEVVEEKEK